jgi:hypothetical protein
VLKGTKQDIARQVANLEGDVREAIVFVEQLPAAVQGVPTTDDDLFKEMEPYMVNVGNADYSREAVYGRTPGE